ncbi:hypothetical protein lerEdw1_020163 [Lerista edwardsae]|nr:hypothetical protein lerEdw1_020163 [Lerista edwardsae]
MLSEKNWFDIRLMKEGRMKGQAFIGLPNEKAAAKALKEANGYILFDKPMVVLSLRLVFFNKILAICSISKTKAGLQRREKEKIEGKPQG